MSICLRERDFSSTLAAATEHLGYEMKRAKRPTKRRVKPRVRKSTRVIREGALVQRPPLSGASWFAMPYVPEEAGEHD